MNFEAQTRAYIKHNFPEVSNFEREKLFNDWMVKERIGRKVFDDFLKRAGDPRGKRILDVGFGNGFLLKAFAEKGAETYGVEIDPVLYKVASSTLAGTFSAEHLSLYDGVHFPYENNFFDFLIATSVLEHVNKQAEFMKDAARILKTGGRFYISFPNRWYPKETHTGIWFLSFLPRDVAQGLMKRLFRRSTMEDWNLHFLSYFSFRRLLKRYQIPFRILYETGGSNFSKRFIKSLLAQFGVHHSALLRTIMVVLEKK